MGRSMIQYDNDVGDVPEEKNLTSLGIYLRVRSKIFEILLNIYIFIHINKL